MVLKDKLRLTFKQLLKELNRSETPLYWASISQYENDIVEPPLEVLLRYARLATVYLDVLIDNKIDLLDAIVAKVKSEGNKLEMIQQVKFKRFVKRIVRLAF